MRLFRTTAVVVLVLGLTSRMPDASPSALESGVAEAADEFAAEPSFRDLPREERSRLVEFVVGNVLFAVLHETGHAVMSEMELPVLGREEDAADSFAILGSLRMTAGFSGRALVAAGKGWFYNHWRDRENGAITAFYDAHGMNLQRAYQIVCFLVGAAPEKFGHLAEATGLPADRRRSCADDYAVAVWSWDRLLGPHRRPHDGPMAAIDVRYGEPDGPLAVYARALKRLRFLEAVAAMAARNFLWRAPVSMELRSCGFVNAKWSAKQRRVTVCYELAAEFADLYREFAVDRASSGSWRAQARRGGLRHAGPRARPACAGTPAEPP